MHHARTDRTLGFNELYYGGTCRTLVKFRNREVELKSTPVPLIWTKLIYKEKQNS